VPAKRCVDAPSDVSTRRPSTASDESKKDALNRENFILSHSGTLTDSFILHKKVGRGTYGSVCKATSRTTGQVRAIKAVSKSHVKNLARFRTEIDIMKSLDHPNIIKLYETFEDARNIYIVMELCTGGELFDRIIEQEKFTERDAARIMKQILSALAYCHANGIMHRDLKPENFLFMSKEPDSPLKVIDFGLSCKFEHGQARGTKAGTPYYVAPQVLLGHYTEAADMWSCGVIMYVLLCGYPPFSGETDAEVLAKVKLGKYSFHPQDWRHVSDEAKDIIRKLLALNPRDRHTAAQALQHPWIVQSTVMDSRYEVTLTEGIINNLRQFRAQHRLKKAALTVIAHHLSEQDIVELKNIFIALDKDNSGTLTYDEIVEGMRAMGWEEFPPDLEEVFNEVDSDRSGQIDYTEFIAATIDKTKYLSEDVCWAAFRVFDLDGDGKISPLELKKALGSPDMKDEIGATVDAIIRDVDKNGDGEIDFEEFVQMMRRAPEVDQGRPRKLPSTQSSGLAPVPPEMMTIQGHTATSHTSTSPRNKKPSARSAAGDSNASARSISTAPSPGEKGERERDWHGWEAGVTVG